MSNILETTPQQDPELWKKIAGIEFDDLSSYFMFSQRLARENGWTDYFARRAIEEYKKFLYLTQVSKIPVTPSFQVDQVWHQHLTYSRDYWDVCDRILRRPLHHGPTKGGRQEADKYHMQYERTLELYKKEFGSEAPKDIWPSSKLRFGRDTNFQWVNVQDNWVLPKPKFRSVLRMINWIF